MHDIFGGKAAILRTGASGDVWQFRTWIAEEHKYVRKTLKTRDLSTARSRAEEEYLKILSDIKSGKRLFGMTLGELVAEYLIWRQQDVSGGYITAGRLGTMTSQLKHLIEYRGADTKISELDRNSIFDYAQWRRTTKNGVQDVTIRNEEVTINHMMSFAFRKGYAHFDKFDFANLRIREVSRRDTFTLEEYDNLVHYLRQWIEKPSTETKLELNDRLMIRDCILIGSNTMLRVGELWQLTWGDIISYGKPEVDDKGYPVTLVTLNVRAETAKTRKSRLITTRGGEYFKMLYQRTRFQGKGDFVFCGSTGNTRLSKRTLYAAWNHLMTAINIDYKKRNLTWYSLRHFGITCRLRAGASIFDVAKISGAGVNYISEHYGHFDQSMARAVALKHFTVSMMGIVVIPQSAKTTGPDAIEYGF